MSQYFVRSKSEAIITNMLCEREIPFKYEEPLFASDGTMYGYYRGLVAPVTVKTIKKPAVKAASKEELEAAEAERAARILALEQELSDLEQKIGDYEELSLTGVQVEFPKYGTGVVTSQKGNKITVQFSDSEKAFVLDERYTARPSFENDKEIVAVFTEYGRMLDRIRKIRRELDSLC